MSTRLDRFNTLPPKPEHLKRVRVAIGTAAASIKLSELVAQTGLTNTQALCALDLLIKNGEAVKERGSNSFRRAALEATLAKNPVN